MGADGQFGCSKAMLSKINAKGGRSLDWMEMGGEERVADGANPGEGH
jgi:hypothetical protein